MRLPGCRAVTGPSALPFLNHERPPGAAHAVRGMKAVMCSKKSSTAARDGAIALTDSVWHFLMTVVMYFAMCSLSVKTLPWPMGALGPRNTAPNRGVSWVVLLTRWGRETERGGTHQSSSAARPRHKTGMPWAFPSATSLGGSRRGR